MTAAWMAWTPWIAVGLAIVVAGLMRWLDRPARDAWLSMAPLVALLPLAAVIVRPDIGPTLSPLFTAVVIGSLARQRDDLLHSECALKLLWVMGVSFALSAAGLALLTLATGTPRNEEQWAVLDMGLDPSFLWMTALPLSMLSGLVLLGGAPFHFWAADLIQGARPWIGPLAVVALQVSGLSWLVARLRGIAAFTAAAQVADGLLTVAAGAAFVVGSVTLIFQRRPERRVGTLASLQGALMLASLVAQYGVRTAGPARGLSVATWSAHLALALAGAAIVTRFVPVSSPGPTPGAVLFRSHPVWAAVGLYALFSLAGVPGTPGAAIWLEAARDLVLTRRLGLLLLLGGAWAVSFAVAMQQLREAFGISGPDEVPPQPVPFEARLAMAIGGIGLAWMLALRVMG
jgi:hypothetical protein